VRVCQRPSPASQKLESLKINRVAEPLPMGLGALPSLTDLSLVGERGWSAADFGVDDEQSGIDLPESWASHQSLPSLPSWVSSRACGSLVLRFLHVEDIDLPVLQSLTALQELHLDLPHLTTLQSLGALTSLERLELRCPALQTLPDCGDRLSKLTDLTVGELPTPQPLSGLRTPLRRLTISSVEQDFFHLPPGSLAQLQDLTISLCSTLQSFPDELCNLTTLKILSISYCSCLEALPESFGNLTALQSLSIKDCFLRALPESLGSLSSLENLDVDVKALPDSLTSLSALQSLKLSGCSSSTEAFLEGSGILTALQGLDTESRLHLESLPEGFGNLAAPRICASKTADTSQHSRKSLAASQLFRAWKLRAAGFWKASLKTSAIFELSRICASKAAGAWQPSLKTLATLQVFRICALKTAAS